MFVISIIKFSRFTHLFSCLLLVWLFTTTNILRAAEMERVLWRKRVYVQQIAEYVAVVERRREILQRVHVVSHSNLSPQNSLLHVLRDHQTTMQLVKKTQTIRNG